MEGGFSQPNGRMCEKMLTWAAGVTRGSSDADLLELYCGNGNFTVALAPNFRRGTRLHLSPCDPCSALYRRRGCVPEQVVPVSASVFWCAGRWWPQR